MIIQKPIFAGFIILTLLTIAACQKGESGDTSVKTREVIGRVASSDDEQALLITPMKGKKTSLNSDCPADTVIATDSAGEVKATAIRYDCGFDLTVNVGKCYVLSFAREGDVLAILILHGNGDSFTLDNFFVSEGTYPCDLGVVTIAEPHAVAEYQPGGQNDSDGDGAVNQEDSDDDNDEVEDVAEKDCDLDGFIDDVDLDMTLCSQADEADEEADSNNEADSSNSEGTGDEEGNGEAETGSGEEAETGSNEAGDSEPVLPDTEIFRVVPPNDEHLELKEHNRILVDEIIGMRVNCEIDEISLNSTTFSVTHSGGELPCTYEIENRAFGSEVTCRHEPMLPDVIYTAVVKGLLCSDGRRIREAGWSWRTAEIKITNRKK